MSNVKGEAIGEKTIDGVAAKGFKATLGDRPVTVWADKKTADPVRVEMPVTIGAEPNDNALMVFDHFVIDPPLDDSLFSTDAPTGYTLTTKKFDVSQMGELADNVAKLLADYADATDGTFPASLSDWAGIIKADADGTKKHPDKKYNFPEQIGMISGMLYSQPPGTSGYAGKGVKLGEKDKIVFWYQPAKAKPGTYPGGVRRSAHRGGDEGSAPRDPADDVAVSHTNVMLSGTPRSIWLQCSRPDPSRVRSG